METTTPVNWRNTPPRESPAQLRIAHDTGKTNHPLTNSTPNPSSDIGKTKHALTNSTPKAWPGLRRGKSRRGRKVLAAIVNAARAYRRIVPIDKVRHGEAPNTPR